MSQESNQPRIKLLTLGNTSVGKSCILNRIKTNEFNCQRETIGIDLIKREMDIQGNNVKLLIWDTAGAEQFRGIVKSYYKGADGVLVTYSITDRQSFQAINYWIHSIMQQCDNQDVQMVLIGNKCDTDPDKRVISYNQGKELARQFNIPFLETSALNSTNCLEALTILAQKCFYKGVETGRFVDAAKSNKKVLSSFIEQPRKEKCKC